MTAILLKNKSINDPYASITSDVSFVPLMEHSFVDQEGLLEYLEGLEFEQIDCTIVTSQRAVEAISELIPHLTEVGKLSLLSKTTYTVGPATAALLRYNGFTDVRGDESGNGTALAEVLSTKHYKRYMFFTGETRRDAIPDRLNSMDGVSLQERVVYKTVPVETSSKDFNSAMDNCSTRPVVVFFSPAFADQIVKELKTRQRETYVLAAIGPTTEEYLKEFGLVPDGVAAKPDPEHLHRAIADYI